MGGVVHRGRGLRLAELVCLAALLVLVAKGQVRLEGGPDGVVRLIPTDLAVFELREPRRDLPCVVTPEKPQLGFDLKLHAGYQVTVPLQELAGREGTLTVLFRVTPVRDGASPVYFVQRVRVPRIEEREARGRAQLEGTFDVGEGIYRVDWLMRDQAERVCAEFWEIEARLSESDREISVALPPGEVAETEIEFFAEEPPVQRMQGERLLNVKVLANFAPHRADAATLLPYDLKAVVSILRALSREPHIGTLSLVAFNLHEQRVIYRQDNASRIDFPALGEALNRVRFGTVSIRQLEEKNPEGKFLAELVRQELGDPGTDAVIFAGPKAMLDVALPAEELKGVAPVGVPVFYLNYIANPQAFPWRDAIGNLVRVLRGVEYTISRPRDLWRALGEMMSRIFEVRNQRLSASAAGR